MLGTNLNSSAEGESHPQEHPLVGPSNGAQTSSTYLEDVFGVHSGLFLSS